jgi:hypothetical protein
MRLSIDCVIKKPEMRKLRNQGACAAVRAGCFCELARLAREAQSEQTRVAAIKEILDRAYGRPTPPIDGDGQGGPMIINVLTGVPR